MRKSRQRMAVHGFLAAVCLGLLAGCGGGRLSAPNEPLPTPTGLAATPGNARVSLAWSTVTNGTTYYIVIGAMWVAGLWRYVEP